MSDDWKYVLNTLESQMSVDFRASVDNTGSLAVGGNWILESDNVNIKDVYFTENIEEWMDILFGISQTSIFITSDRKVYAMGWNNYGQIGLGNNTTPVTVPTLITSISSENIVNASVGYSSAYVTSSGKVYTTGENSRGQLGLGDTTARNTPTLVTTLSNVKIVQAVINDTNSIFLDSSGRVYTSGGNGDGQLGIGTTVDRSTPILVSTISNEFVIKVTLGIGAATTSHSAAAVTNTGKLYTWGGNESGQLGLWTQTATFTTPQLVTQYSTGSVMLPLPNIISVTMGGPTTFFLDASGIGYGVGINWDGRAGINYDSTNFPEITAPRRFYGVPETITQICSGRYAGILLTSSGKVYTWGKGENYQLGHRNTTNYGYPRLVSDLSNINIVQVYIAGGYSMCLDNSGNVYGVGSNANRQMGQANTNTITSFKTLTELSSYQIVSIGSDSRYINMDQLQKITPEISGSLVSTALVYGQQLSSSTISGVMREPANRSIISGTFAFSSPSTKPSVSTTSASYIFTPNDTTYYNIMTGSVSITVTKTTPDVSGSLLANSISYGQFLSVSGTFKNSNDSSVVSGSLVLDATSSRPPVGTSSYNWTFTPTDSTNYNVQTGTVSITVTKTTPDVSGSVSATSISVGQALSDSTLSGSFKNSNNGSEVTGNLVFDSPSSTPSVGTSSHNWTFTPTDLSNYNVQTGSVDVTVNGSSKVTPSISVPITTQQIYYGQTLSDTNIDGVFVNSNTSSIVSGTLAFDFPSDIPYIYTTTATWTFTPTDLNSYEIVTGTADIVVNKATPTGTPYLMNPSIQYGATPDDLGLDGVFTNPHDSSVVYGNLMFDSGSSLTIGTNTLYWTFYPTDSGNYDSIFGSIECNVNKVEPMVNVTISDINYGQMLGDAVQFVSASHPTIGSWTVTGTFTLSDSPSSVPSAGQNEVSWTFTPDDTTNYDTFYGSSIFQVIQNLITPSLVGDFTASTLTYGQSYYDSTLTYSFVDPDTNEPISGTASITWTESNTIAPVGINFYSYTFTPTNYSIYGQYTGTVQLEVVKATPTIYNLSVSSINLGDTIGDAVFTKHFVNNINGTIVADIDGTISFDTPSTVPTANDETSYPWTFIPLNTTNYNNATGSISVTVIVAGETPSLSGSITSTNNTGNASVLGANEAMEQVALSSLNAVFIPLGSKLGSNPITGSFINQSSQSVSGVLKFTNRNYVPTLADTSANWTFTPANRSLYNIVTGSVSIRVGYPVGSTAVIPIVSNIASNIDVSSSPTETIFVDKEVFGNSGLILAAALTNSTQLESRLSSTTTDTSYVPVTVVGQTATNNFSNIPYSVKLSNIPPSKPALYTLLPSPYFNSPVQNATTLAVMSYRVIDSCSNTFVSDLTATPITAEFNLGLSYANQALVVHHIDASNNITSSTNVNADASGVVTYQMTKNPNLVITTQVINSSGNVSIFLPYVFDLSANGVVFGEEVQGISADYYLEEDVSKSILTVSLLKAALKYKDDLDSLYSNDLSSEELPVPSQQSLTNITSNMNRIVDVSNLKYWQGSNNYTNSATSFSTASLGEHYIQYIASVLFGHPQAQAPIKNDEQIIIDLSNCNIGGQFGGSSGLSDLGVRKFIFEQLVNNSKNTSNASGSRFDISDTDPTPSSGYVSYPFEEGDEIIIRIRMSGGLDTDSATAFTQVGTSPIDLVNIFGQTQGITNSNNSLSISPKVWAIKFVLGA
jgi:alpha-tubulin suppressor-like RCC1 family protein